MTRVYRYFCRFRSVKRTNMCIIVRVWKYVFRTGLVVVGGARVLQWCRFCESEARERYAKKLQIYWRLTEKKKKRNTYMRSFVGRRTDNRRIGWKKNRKIVYSRSLTEAGAADAIPARTHTRHPAILNTPAAVILRVVCSTDPEEVERNSRRRRRWTRRHGHRLGIDRGPAARPFYCARRYRRDRRRPSPHRRVVFGLSSSSTTARQPKRTPRYRHSVSIIAIIVVFIILIIIQYCRATEKTEKKKKIHRHRCSRKLACARGGVFFSSASRP